MRFVLFLSIILTITSCHAQLRLNHIQLKGTHNSFHVSTPPSLPEWDASLPSLSTQASTLNVRAFELDVTATEGKFDVFHFEKYDQGTNCANFTSCITNINDWAKVQTNPPIIFIQLEDKYGGATALSWDDMDKMLLSIIGRQRLITPADVRGSYPTLRDAIINGTGWPTLESARGKFIIFLDEDYSSYRQGKYADLTDRVAFPAFADTTNPLAAFIKLNDPEKDGTKIKSAVASNFIVRTRADTDLVNLPIPVTYDDAVNRLFKRLDLDNNSLVNFDELFNFLQTLQPQVIGIKHDIERVYNTCKDGSGNLTMVGYKCVENAGAQLNQGLTLKENFDTNGYKGQTILDTTRISNAAIASGAHIISTDYPGGDYTFKGLGTAANLTYAFTLPYPYICNPISTFNMTCSNYTINGLPDPSSPTTSSPTSTGGSNPTTPGTTSTGTSSTGKNNNAIIHIVSGWNVVIIMIVAIIMM